LKFLRDNHFDFNKLFSEGIVRISRLIIYQSYQKLVKKEEVLEKCRKIYDTSGASTNNFSRYYTHLGSTSQALLVQHIEAVEKFIADTNSSTKNEQINLEVKSHALKR
jgi:Tfp pilus assembly protein PilE